MPETLPHASPPHANPPLYRPRNRTADIDLEGLRRSIAGGAAANPRPGDASEQQTAREPDGRERPFAAAERMPAEAIHAAPGEGDMIGADAASGVKKNLAAADTVQKLLTGARTVFEEIERKGLALIERQQAELAAFEREVAAFVGNGGALSQALGDVFEKMRDAQR